MSKNTLLSELINYISANSSGNVVIAAPTSGYALDVTGTGRFTSTLTTNTIVTSNPLAINLNYAGSVNDIQLGAGTPMRIVNQAYNSVLFYLNNAGNVGIGTSSPGATLHVNGGLRLQGGSTDLNYYEEGSWTPSLANATVTYTYRSGSYVRIGKYVFIRWGFRVNTISGQSGTLAISGLPFTSINWGSYQEPNISVSTGNLGTADYAQRARVYVGGADTTLYGRIANNGDTPWATSEINNGSWVIGEIFYNIS